MEMADAMSPGGAQSVFPDGGDCLQAGVSQRLADVGWLAYRDGQIPPVSEHLAIGDTDTPLVPACASSASRSPHGGD